MSENKDRVPFSKSNCCGCGVCAAICPKSAITMEADEEGFLYPRVNEEQCVHCGLCLDHCAFFKRDLAKDSDATQPKVCFLVKHKSIATRMHSRSGGVFVSVSDWILQKHGVIYGCIIDESLKVSHACATNATQRNAMCQSKYVQSDTSEIWDQVGSDLAAGRFVLFTGTGCQIDALYSYLRQNNVAIDKLFTIDLICHGAPSPKLFSEHIEWIEKKYKAKVEKFNFRDKTLCGWGGHIESYIVKNKRRQSTCWRNIYFTDCCIRPSCLNCKYATTARVGDITIGDAWGIENAKPEFNDNLGVSLVLVNSSKGMEMFDSIQQACFVEQVEIEPMLQPNMVRPSYPVKVKREQFWIDYQDGGIRLLIRKYGADPLYKRPYLKLKHRYHAMKFAKKMKAIEEFSGAPIN